MRLDLFLVLFFWNEREIGEREVRGSERGKEEFLFLSLSPILLLLPLLQRVDAEPGLKELDVELD